MNQSQVGYVSDIEALTLQNNYFRQVLFTARNSQLVLMALQPGEDIGVEVHTVDQFFRIESGTGEIVLNGETTAIKDGSAIVVPAGTEHNLKNTGSEVMHLYTIYTPPQHPDGTVHKTKEEAMQHEHEH